MTQDERAAREHGLVWVKSLGREDGGDYPPGLATDPRAVHTGGNSGYQALNVALHCGAPRWLLLGFDMQLGPGGRAHFHGAHPGAMNNPDAGTIRGWIRAFETLPAQLAALGVEVINCSRDTALTSFPRATIQEALR